MEACSHPPGDSVGPARRDHRRVSAGGTEFGARSVAFIGVGAVVVLAPAGYRLAGRHLGYADQSPCQDPCYIVLFCPLCVHLLDQSVGTVQTTSSRRSTTAIAAPFGRNRRADRSNACRKSTSHNSLDGHRRPG